MQDKTFEIRNNDRNFQVGDRIDLLEWNPDTKEYTGREVEGRITYITNFAQKEGFVVFQFEIVMLRE